MRSTDNRETIGAIPIAGTRFCESVTDAVLVAGPGLIIRKRKLNVGSNPTCHTKEYAS